MKLKRFAQTLRRELLGPLAFFCLVIVPLKSAVVDWNWVPSGSMKPTILEGELVLVNKLAYDLKVPLTTTHLAMWSGPARGDVAVFFKPGDGTRLVKRVVAVPGDTVELRDEILYLNGAPQRYTAQDTAPFQRDIFEDPKPVVAIEHLDGHAHYVMALPHRAAMRSFGPYTVPAGKYFMMGDSRDNSADSRYFGPVDRDQIVGRASRILVSFDPQRWLLPRLSRIAAPLELAKAR